MFSIKLTPKYPTYPPYHQGEYLEDYFISYQENNSINTDRQFIPVSWTTYYCDKYSRKELQDKLNSLDKTQKYYLVCQHDDAPQEVLPPNTLVFSAGGNYTGNGVIPIPLVCSSLPDEYKIENEKTALVSFVGSVTHPIRVECIKSLSNKDGVRLFYKQWSNAVPEDQFMTFINETKNSTFCLAPRGYGKSSFRMYEAMQLDSIPVYVSDSHYLPFTDELTWNDFAVIISPEQIKDLYKILNSYSSEDIIQMRSKMKDVYHNYFTLDGMCSNIKRILENEK